MLQKFIEQYYPAISDRIEQQQITYGLARIHSHRHISRCIIYSDWYADLLNIGKDSIERMQLYFAIGFHDIGRQGELEDVWESISVQIYNDYLKSNNIDKYNVNNNTILLDIIHDVDCLDIMRSGTGRGGIMGFDKKYLNLFKENVFLQDKIISNAWQLINNSDSIEYDTKECLKSIHELNLNKWI